jgi:hypothetical protein
MFHDEIAVSVGGIPATSASLREMSLELAENVAR